MEKKKKTRGRPTDFDYLIDHFAIRPNLLAEPNDGYYLFETYGEEYEEVMRWLSEKGPNYVWTIIDCGENLYATPGWHYVNRLGYLLAELPWKEGQRDLKY